MLSEDKALCKIDEDTFNKMSGGYQQERAELRVKTDALQAELDTFNSDSVRADKFIEIVRRYTGFEELTSVMLNEYIDKVIVHEGEWSNGNTGLGGRPRGSRTQRVDVYLKYIGSFDVPDTRTPEEFEAERVTEEKAEARRKKQREYARRKAAEKRALKLISPEKKRIVL